MMPSKDSLSRKAPPPTPARRVGRSYLLTDLVLCSLPMRNPGQVRDWTRTNGAMRLTVEAGWYRDRSGAKIWQVPYGKTARGLLLWLCTEAKRTGQRRIELGDSLRSFMLKLGLSDSGTNYPHTMRMLQAVATMRMDLEIEHHQASDESLGMIRGSANLVAEDWQLYFGASEQPEGQDGLLGPSWFELSEKFFRSLQDHAMPVDTTAWAWLNQASKSPMPLDVYVWLAYRLPHVSPRGVAIPWASLLAQFGSGNVTNARKARADFKKALELVLEVYPQAAGAVEVTREGLTLKRAPAPVKGRAKGQRELPTGKG